MLHHRLFCFFIGFERRSIFVMADKWSLKTLFILSLSANAFFFLMERGFKKNNIDIIG